uniref:Major sperm protein n=1 Tax=Panagrellus redivivus TaxID=6233 RepID=A0A7E4UYI2_PANRE
MRKQPTCQNHPVEAFLSAGCLFASELTAVILDSRDANMYADDDYDLYLAPRVAQYSPLKGGTSRHLMVNGTQDRMAIKVKCSNNEMYRVSPVYTCLEPGCSQRLQVIRDPGEPKLDKLIVLYKKTTLKNAMEAFYHNNEEDPPTEVKKALIALVALKHQGQPESGESNSSSNGSSNGQKKPKIKSPIGILTNGDAGPPDEKKEVKSVRIQEANRPQKKLSILAKKIHI